MKILWSIVLANLCAASFLDHFTEVVVQSGEPAAIPVDFDITPVQLIEMCAEVCFSMKYSCNAFLAIIFPDGTRHCAMSPNRQFSDEQFDYLMMAIYTITVPRRFDLEELSRNIESRDEWIDNVEKGYLPSLHYTFWIPFLDGCRNSALNGTPATVVDIEDTRDEDTGDEDTGERKAKRRKISRDSIDKVRVSRKIPGHSITAEILLGLKSWPHPSEFSDIIALAFLEIFSHNIVPSFTTVFDPIKKSLFIHGNDIYLFIVSGKGNYFIIEYRPEPQNQPLIYATDPSLKSEFALKMFQEAMNLLGPQQPFAHSTPLGFKHLVQPVSAVILQATGILLSHLNISQDVDDSGRNIFLKCLDDMVKFVLFKVYRKDIRSQIRLWKSSVENHFENSMLDIITYG